MRARVTYETVVCARPGGCGWSWERVTTRPRLRRPVIEWHGPAFADGSRIAWRRHTNAAFRLDYADCLRHLKVTP